MENLNSGDSKVSVNGTVDHQIRVGKFGLKRERGEMTTEELEYF